MDSEKNEKGFSLAVRKKIEAMKKSWTSWTAKRLGEAVEQWKEKEVSLWLALGANPNSYAVIGTDFPIISRVARGGHASILKKLIKKGGDPEIKTHDDWRPIHLAALKGHDDCVKVLVENDVDFHVRTPLGWTPLFCAIKEGRLSTARLLIELGADVNDVIASDTMLTKATRMERADIVELLIEKGADIHKMTEAPLPRFAPIHIAAGMGNIELILLLKNKGADLEMKGAFGRTPLTCAYGSEKKLAAAKIEEMLLEKEARATQEKGRRRL